MLDNFAHLYKVKIMAEEIRDNNEELRIGVYVCHCGVNVGGVVDCPDVAEYAKTLPGVVHATDYKYMCSGNLVFRAIYNGTFENGK